MSSFKIYALLPVCIGLHWLVVNSYAECFFLSLYGTYVGFLAITLMGFNVLSFIHKWLPNGIGNAFVVFTVLEMLVVAGLVLFLRVENVVCLMSESLSLLVLFFAAVMLEVLFAVKLLSCKNK